MKLKDTKLIGSSSRVLANKLHNDEHIIVSGENASHKAEYYYHMACWIYNSIFDELDEIKKLIKRRTVRK